jgi:hypothetical protein
MCHVDALVMPKSWRSHAAPVDDILSQGVTTQPAGVAPIETEGTASMWRHLLFHNQFERDV